MAVEPSIHYPRRVPAYPARMQHPPRFVDNFDEAEFTDIHPDDKRKLGMLRRAYEKLNAAFKKHGGRLLRHTAVLAMTAALVAAILKALDNPIVSETVQVTTGKIKAVAELVAISFAMHKLVQALLDAASPPDDTWRTPSVRERIADLERKNQELLMAAREAQEAVVRKEQLRKKDHSKDALSRYRKARQQNQQPINKVGIDAPDIADSDFDWDGLGDSSEDTEARGSTDVTIYDKASLMVSRARNVLRRYGKTVLKKSAVLAAVVGAMLALARILRHPSIANKIMSGAGELEQVLRLSTLGFALYHIATLILDSVDTQDETVRESLDKLAEANTTLGEAVKTSQEMMLKMERDRRISLSEERVKEIKRMRSKANQFRSSKDIRDPVLEENATPATAFTPALAAVASHVRYAVSAAAILGLQADTVPSRSALADQRFLSQIQAMDADDRRAYATRLAKNPEAASGFFNRVADILRRMRKDPVGGKLVRLGGFVVKWTAIFAVQAVMFRLLVLITKKNFFDIVGSTTQLGLAALCAVNSVLVLLKTAGPEDADALVKKAENLALQSKRAITQNLLPQAA